MYKLYIELYRLVCADIRRTLHSAKPIYMLLCIYLIVQNDLFEVMGNFAAYIGYDSARLHIEDFLLALFYSTSAIPKHLLLGMLLMTVGIAVQDTESGYIYVLRSRLSHPSLWWIAKFFSLLVLALMSFVFVLSTISISQLISGKSFGGLNYVGLFSYPGGALASPPDLYIQLLPLREGMPLIPLLLGLCVVYATALAIVCFGAECLGIILKNRYVGLVLFVLYQLVVQAQMWGSVSFAFPELATLGGSGTYTELANVFTLGAHSFDVGLFGHSIVRTYSDGLVSIYQVVPFATLICLFLTLFVAALCAGLFALRKGQDASVR